MWGPGAWENWQTRYIGISFCQRLVSLHIPRTLLHTQLSHQAHQEWTNIQYSPTSTQMHHQSLHDTHQQGDEHTVWMHQSHLRNDRQSQELSSRAGLMAYRWHSTGSCTGKSPQIWQNHYPGPYPQHATSSEGAGTTEQTYTPYQWHQTNHVLHALAGTNSEGGHWYSYSQTTIEPRSKPTTLAAKLSKHERHHKRPATQLHNAVIPTSSITRIRMQAQVATVGAQVAPPSSKTHSCMWLSDVPPPTSWPGFAAAVMKQQRHQHRLVQLTCRITKLENEVHQAMAVMDKDTGKLLNYRQLMNSLKYKKSMEPVHS